MKTLIIAGILKNDLRAGDKAVCIDSPKDVMRRLYRDYHIGSYNHVSLLEGGRDDYVFFEPLPNPHFYRGLEIISIENEKALRNVYFKWDIPFGLKIESTLDQLLEEIFPDSHKNFKEYKYEKRRPEKKEKDSLMKGFFKTCLEKEYHNEFVVDYEQKTQRFKEFNFKEFTNKLLKNKTYRDVLEVLLGKETPTTKDVLKYITSKKRVCKDIDRKLEALSKEHCLPTNKRVRDEINNSYKKIK